MKFVYEPVHMIDSLDFDGIGLFSTEKKAQKAMIQEWDLNNGTYGYEEPSEKYPLGRYYDLYYPSECFFIIRREVM